MIKLLMVVMAWRTIRVLVRIAAVVVIGGLLLGYLSFAGLGRHTTVTRLRHAIAPIERQLQSTLEQAAKP